MLDACTITRVTGSTTDSATGVRTLTTSTIYTGKCRLQERSATARPADPAPDQEQLARHKELQLPVSTSTGVRVGDRVSMTTCVHDADAVGQVLVVREETSKSEATARRLGVEVITG